MRWHLWTWGFVKAGKYILPNWQEGTKMFPQICYAAHWLTMLMGVKWKEEFSSLINLEKFLPKTDFFPAEPLRAFYMVKYVLNFQGGYSL